MDEELDLKVEQLENKDLKFFLSNSTDEISEYLLSHKSSIDMIYQLIEQNTNYEEIHINILEDDDFTLTDNNGNVWFTDSHFCNWCKTLFFQGYAYLYHLNKGENEWKLKEV